MVRRRKPLLLLGVVLVVVLSGAWTEANRPVRGPHGRLALALFRSVSDTLPVLRSNYFWTSGRCAGCHGRDLLGEASIDPANGRDVNVVNDWRSTLMANSARDPFFRAKLDHEALVNPAHSEALSNKCLSCHAPLAMHEERMAGRPPFTAAMLDTSVLAGDGVSCLACHMQSPIDAGHFFSGDLHFDSAHVYGPYADDQIDPNIMQSFVGFTPGFGDHMVNSEVCAGCHTLITQTVDLQGNTTGDEFVEQATYHEWKNSVYSANDVHCNTCHMPRVEGPVILAAEYAFLPGQTPFGLHHLAGANVHMLEIMKANREALHIPATEEQFDSTIARTKAMLMQRTMDVDLDPMGRTADTAFFDVRLTNRAGHRFPSGYPSRRAFVRLVVRNADGDTVFASGLVDDTFEVLGHDTPYEPHHDVIRREEDVQIYELVMGDVNGDPTTVLERAKTPLKDDRLVPLGFTTTHASYDTMRIAGVALNDIDFNHDAFGAEGSGTDVVHYHVPVSGVNGALLATAQVYYQPIPPAWNAAMFAFNSAYIDTFRTMLGQSDHSPILVAADSIGLGPLGVAASSLERITVSPNPSLDGTAEIRFASHERVELVTVYDARGAVLSIPTERRNNSLRLTLPPVAGVYLIHLLVNGSPVLKRIVRR
ncbi:MAG: T9SS type A sorting domain-containing protein [Flavobacteriales bacterium]|nr:T9SS type A sorting domain-containing protein [Flavobacteriales bacterium]